MSDTPIPPANCWLVCDKIGTIIRPTLSIQALQDLVGSTKIMSVGFFADGGSYSIYYNAEDPAKGHLLVGFSKESESGDWTLADVPEMDWADFVSGAIHFIPESVIPLTLLRA